MHFQPGGTGGMVDAACGIGCFKGDADLVQKGEGKRMDITFRMAIAGALAVVIVVLLKNIE